MPCAPFVAFRDNAFQQRYVVSEAVPLYRKAEYTTPFTPRMLLAIDFPAFVALSLQCSACSAFLSVESLASESLFVVVASIAHDR